MDLVLKPTHPERRWRHYLLFLCIVGAVFVACVVYVLWSVEPSYWAACPTVIAVYLLGSSLRGLRRVKTIVARVEGDRFVSVSWRGSVSSISLAGTRSIRQRWPGLIFRDRWRKSWSGYLGGASDDARQSFLRCLYEDIENRFPRVKIYQ